MDKYLSPKLILCDDNVLEYFCPGCMMLHPVTILKRNSVGAIWQWDGDVLTPTLSPSVLVVLGNNPRRVCHAFVQAGKINFLDDCSHDLKGQIVDLPDIPEDWL